MEFTFYGGVGEIGGNKFLLEHEDTRVFLDFGKSFSKENEYFDFPLLQPFYTPDLKKIQAIPDIAGLYRDSVEKPEMDGILVSHAHADHFGYLSLLNSRVSVHLGEAAPERVERRCETEEDVESEMRKLIEDLEGLVLFETCPADIDRIRTLWKVARSTGRKLILDYKQAYLTYELDKRDLRLRTYQIPGTVAST